jgi:hypothetical protein
VLETMSKPTHPAFAPRRFVRTGVALSAAFTLLAAPGAARAQQPPGLAFVVQDGAAQPAAPRPEPAAPSRDPFFPGAGHVSLSLASGVPFAAIGEVAVGTSDAFALSAIAGVADTFHESAVGGSARVAVVRSGGFELVLSLPVLYYPPAAVRGDDPWVLTNPSLVGAYQWGRASVYGGAGGLFTACVGDLAVAFGGKPEKESRPSSIPMVNGAWNTFHLGGAFALTPRVGLFLQTTFVMSGLELAQSYGEKVGPPVVALLGARVVL